MLDEFRSLRWMGTVPKHLDFANTQFLLIGESSGIEKAVQSATNEDQKKDGGDKKDEKEPIEELEDLEDEDTERMQHLSKDGSTAIFADLEAHARDYPKLQTTF